MRKKITLVVFLGVVVIAAGCGANFMRGKYVVPILMYHSVYPDAPYSNRLAVSTGTFERQMRFLREHRYNVIGLADLAQLTSDKKRIPARTVAITLDDGYMDNYTYAFPILKRYNIPVTVFLIVQEIGRPAGDRLSWEKIKFMQESGLVTIGSHAIGPEPLVNITSREEVRRQVFSSKKALEERLGSPVTLFSYPEGMFNPEIRTFVIEAGYRAAVATRPGRGYPSNDCFALKRLRISENAANMFVFWVETSGYYTFFKERRRK